MEPHGQARFESGEIGLGGEGAVAVTRRPQGMILRNPGLQLHVAEQMPTILVSARITFSSLVG